MTAQVWGKLAVAFALAAVAVVVVPKLGTGDAQPGVGTLLAAGAVVAVLTTGALYVVLRSDLGLPASIALLAVGYNALVVLVKFVLAPRGLYEVSEAGKLRGVLRPERDRRRDPRSGASSSSSTRSRSGSSTGSAAGGWSVRRDGRRSRSAGRA